MAENQPIDNKTKKRLVKNPETFRERAIKASEEGDKPRRMSRFKTASGKVATPVFRPIGSAGRKVGGFGPFKFLRKPLRIVGLILLPRYIRGSWTELRQVSWPNWQTARQLTFAVLLFASVFGVIVAIVDFGLDRLFRDILLK